MSKAQILQIFITELSKIISVDLEAIAKYREMTALQTRMRDFALKKLQIGG